MFDAIFIATTLGCFVVSLLYVSGLDRLKRRKPLD